MNTVTTNFRLGIRFPNKYGSGYTLGYVYFPTELKRDNYVRKEYTFCKREEKAHRSALYSNQRLATIRELYNQRKVFADKNNLAIVMVGE